MRSAGFRSSFFGRLDPPAPLTRRARSKELSKALAIVTNGVAAGQITPANGDLLLHHLVGAWLTGEFMALVSRIDRPD